MVGDVRDSSAASLEVHGIPIVSFRGRRCGLIRRKFNVGQRSGVAKGKERWRLLVRAHSTLLASQTALLPSVESIQEATHTPHRQTQKQAARSTEHGARSTEHGGQASGSDEDNGGAQFKHLFCLCSVLGVRKVATACRRR